MAELSDSLGVTPSLADALDHLLDRGAVLTGEAMLSLAGVDLVYLGLNLVIGSVETLRRQGAGSSAPLRPIGAPPRQRIQTSATPAGLPPPASAPPDTGADAGRYEPVTGSLAPGSSIPEDTGTRPEAGLARLVLTLIELLRELLERQAVRRMEGEGLSDDAIERMGRALIDLQEKMAELREIFGLSAADLRLDLGPLGPLL